MYQLEEPFYFYLLLVVPILLIGFLILISWKQSIQKKYISNHLFKKLRPESSSFKPKFKLFLLSLAFIFISLGLVNPKIGTQLKTVKREGVDIVFAIDVSKSMLAEDIAPNRLEKAKRIVSQTINELNSDRVGIIAYAASALPVLPITTDYSTARMFLQSLNTDMLSSQGTAILEAVKLAKDYYDDENQTNRVLCILSDGEDHEFENQNIPSAVNEMGISIFTVGLGSTKGAPIPIKKNNVIESYKKNSSPSCSFCSSTSSQFTLHALTKKGNRPSYIKAAKSDYAKKIYQKFLTSIETRINKKPKAGIFGADMLVKIENDGPVTIFIDSQNKE